MFQYIPIIFGLAFQLFLVVILICILMTFIRAHEMAKNISVVLSHWSHMIEGLEGSSQQF